MESLTQGIYIEYNITNFRSLTGYGGYIKLQAAETVDIGENVVFLGHGMFEKAKYLKYIYCYANTAPTV